MSVPDPPDTAAAAALQAAFDRLAPQGSDAWNFLAAFTHLGDRFGPYSPGASALSELLVPPAGAPGRAGRNGRGRRHGNSGEEKGELEEAMAQVVEAFRFLSARMRTVEERLARQDRPLEGAAWLIPATELGPWVDPIVAHVVATSPGGEVLHGDCGRGDLLAALSRAGHAASGAEPRGGVALQALEQGCAVVISEVSDALAARPLAHLGGLVLSGVVDRLPLHDLVGLLALARRALAHGAPIVLVCTEPEHAAASRDVVADELLSPRVLHAATWQVLLERAGFVGGAPLAGGDIGDGRVAVVATVPT